MSSLVLQELFENKIQECCCFLHLGVDNSPIKCDNYLINK